MRIQSQNQTIDTSVSTNTVKHNSIQAFSTSKEEVTSEKELPQSQEQVESKEKLKQAIDSINEIFEINQSTSKFVFHEGLDRYYVELVDKETEEVVKEIPPKKLLDAFYEMQKLVGMIVDEKI